MVTEKQALEYFTKEKPSVKTLVFGVIGIIAGLGFLFDGSIWIGLIIIGVCAAGIYGYKEMKANFPTDEAIDKSFAELTDIKRQEALKKIDLEQSEMVREPLSIIGVGKYDYSKQGDDEIVRYNPHIVEIVIFGKKQLIVNEVIVDLTNQKEYKARTNEFFYQDVSAVSIYDDENGKKFAIKVHGQTECNVSISDRYIDIAEEAVKSIRKVLREEKA